MLERQAWMGVTRWCRGWRLATAALVSVMVLAGAASAQAGPGVSFALNVDYATDRGPQDGQGPVAVAVGDFNGDGRADLVTGNNIPAGTLSVFIANADGTFKARSDYAAGTYPLSVAVGDFNRDGRVDLVAGNYANAAGGGAAQTVSVLLGRGDGTFEPRVEYATGKGPSSVVVSDVNRDGNPDVVTSNLIENTVSVLLGRGDGTFAAKSDYPTGGGPNAVAVGDLDKDGSPDLVTANADGSVSVLRGNSNGTFAPRSDYLASLGQGDIRQARPYAVAIKDLNGDGNPDLATASVSVDRSTYNGVSVLSGRGDGTFAPMTAYQNDHGPISIAVGDFNDDGHPDLATASLGGGAFGAAVLVANADGTFAPQTEYQTGGATGSVAVGDFNGDALPDLATANRGNNTVSVLLNTTDVRAPAIVIAAPGDAASYGLDQEVAASYSCQDAAGGSGVKSCAGPVASGAALDTSTVGAHAFTVTSSDVAGNTAATTVSYTVSAPPPPPPAPITAPPALPNTPPPPPAPAPAPDKTAPSISRYGLTNNPFVTGGSTPVRRAAAKAKKYKPGTAFRYTLSETASVRIAISRRVAGRRKGTRCITPTPSLRKARACTRAISRGTLTRAGRKGANTLAFSGRIGSRTLKAGRYQATITATDAAKNTSKPKTVFFTIAKR